MTGESYIYCGNNPINRIDPTGMNWYTNNETGNYEYFEGSAEIDGYKNLGATYDINVSNTKTGEYAGTMHLMINGDARYVQTNSDGSNAKSTEITNQTFDPGWESGHKIKAGNWGLRTLSDMWNSPLAKEFINDQYSIGISTQAGAILGISNTSINFTLLTRGEPGIFYTPSAGISVGDGTEGSVTLAFSKGNYTGNSRTITSSYLQGYSGGASIGLGFIGAASLGASYAPSNIDNLSEGGFINKNFNIGFGIDFGATGANIQLNGSKTPIVKPILKF